MGGLFQIKRRASHVPNALKTIAAMPHYLFYLMRSAHEERDL
jgi:hypothetical protein